MTERYVQIGTPAEILTQFAKETCQNFTIAKLIADKDSEWVEKTLIENGLMRKGDKLTVSFVVDDDAFYDSVSRRARIYAAHETPDGRLVATELVAEYLMGVDFNRDN